MLITIDFEELLLDWIRNSQLLIIDFRNIIQLGVGAPLIIFAPTMDLEKNMNIVHFANTKLDIYRTIYKNVKVGCIWL